MQNNSTFCIIRKKIWQKLMGKIVLNLYCYCEISAEKLVQAKKNELV